jgi:hypothetical protein
MNESVENLLLEHLKRFQAGQDRIERKLEEVVNRLGHLELSVASLRRDRINDRIQAPEPGQRSLAILKTRALRVPPRILGFTWF